MLLDLICVRNQNVALLFATALGLLCLIHNVRLHHECLCSNFLHLQGQSIVNYYKLEMMSKFHYENLVVTQFISCWHHTYTCHHNIWSCPDTIYQVHPLEDSGTYLFSDESSYHLLHPRNPRHWWETCQTLLGKYALLCPCTQCVYLKPLSILWAV